MVGEEIVCDAFGEVVQAEVEPVDVEMHEVPIAGGLAHITQTVLHPNVMGILRVVGAIAARIPGDEAPGIGKAGTKDELVEYIHR